MILANVRTWRLFYEVGTVTTWRMILVRTRALAHGSNKQQRRRMLLSVGPLLDAKEKIVVACQLCAVWSTVSCVCSTRH